MPSVYLPKSVHERLKRFITKSRVSSEFGSPKRFNKPSEAISFFLSIGEKYSIETLEEIVSQPFISGEITERTYDKEISEAKEGAKNE